ncbi:MAG: methyltransferase domain-containing protein [Planctomycetota bacterium]|nr:methyltransferase domain-containing protein [Planctomycetota bacterium]
MIDQPTTNPSDQPAGLPEIPGGWSEQTLLLASRELRLTLPADPDAFLDDPKVLAANRQDDYMPYWSFLWPASLETAVAILKHPWVPGTEVLEIGAGVALAGLAALACGLPTVISDYDPQALELARHNANRNGWGDRVETLLLDWRSPIDRRFPVILGCEVIYERRNHELVLNVLSAMLAPGGEAWISDPGRHQVDAFLDDVSRSPFSVERRPLPREPYPGRPDGQTDLYVLRWKSGQKPA